jgi:16S rRNA (cytosine1402-N4)-methyltransferase
MPDQVLAALAPSSGSVLLDATVGLGGHAAAWLEATAPDGRVIGIDRDGSALERAARELARFGERATLRHADYRDAGALLDELGIETIDAVLVDLGLGSHQIDDPERGFSFRFDGPLDMRFDREAPAPTAAEILARTPEPGLAKLFSEYGEIRAARKLARAIVDIRGAEPIRTTARFAEIVRSVLPRGGRPGADAAVLAFQALRIAVNDELSGLDGAIETLVRRLAPGGRIAVLSFHSLEDRIVKRALRRLAEPCRCRRGDPCTCGAVELIELRTRKPERPGEDEIAGNPRARSARLRSGVRR